jgi:hypothetical protein
MKTIYLDGQKVKRLNSLLKGMTKNDQLKSFGQILSGVRGIPTRLYIKLRLQGVL